MKLILGKKNTGEEPPSMAYSLYDDGGSLVLKDSEMGFSQIFNGPNFLMALQGISGSKKVEFHKWPETGKFSLYVSTLPQFTGPETIFIPDEEQKPGA